MKELICKADKCNNIARCKGYCSKHYWQINQHGRLTPELELAHQGEICLTEGCNKPTYSKNLCKYHWQKQRNEEKKNEIMLGIREIKICQVEGCNSEVLCRDYCSRHWYQIQRYGVIKHILPAKQSKLGICKINNCNEKNSYKGLLF